MASRLFQQKIWKVDDLKPKLNKAVNQLKSSSSYTTTESIEALKTIRDASNHQYLQLALGDHLADTGYVSLLVKIYKSLKEGDAGSNKYNTKHSEQLISNIVNVLTTLAQFTAESEQCCTALKNEDILPFFFDQLRKTSLPFDELDKNSQHEIPLILAILCHCIRHCGDLRTLYRKLDAVPLLSKFLNTEEVIVKTISLVTLAYVVDETESDKLATTGTDGCVNFLIFRLKTALHSRIHRAGGFTAAGVLKGLIHLMASDSNKAKVMEQGALPLILRMLKRAEKKAFSEEEQVLAATAIWKFAFIDSNRAALKADRDVLDALNDFKTSKNAKLRDACCGALWEIYEGQMKIEVEGQRSRNLTSNEAYRETNIGTFDDSDDEVDQNWEAKSKGKKEKKALGLRGKKSANAASLPQAKPHQAEPQSHVMISYQWDTQKLMIQVKNALQKAGYNVWMDVEKMEGNILAAMANAVEKADVVLVAMSHKYKDSNNCRTEASYAYKMKKPIIPLLVEDDYDPDGWLGALVGMLLYYKVINKDTLSKQIPLIMKEIGNNGRIIGAVAKQAFQSTTTKTTPMPADVDNTASANNNATRTTKAQLDNDGADLSSCPEWTTERVQQWLSENNLIQMKTAMKDYDGRCLVHMGTLAQRCPEFFYQTLQREFHLDLLSVIKLSLALENISE